MKKTNKGFKYSIKKFRKLSLEQKFSFLAGIFAVVFFSLLALSSIFLQKNLKEEQDLRKEASIPSGVVEIRSQDAQEYWMVGGSLVDVLLEINTQDIPVSGLQLDFDVLGKVSEPVINTITTSGILEVVTQEVSTISGGYHIQVILNPVLPDLTITNSDYEGFLRIAFIPQESGIIRLEFDPETSLALGTKRDEDILQTIPAMEFIVHSEPQELESCPKPLATTISSLSCNASQKLTAVLSWQPVAGATEYAIQNSRRSDFSEYKTNTPTLATQNTSINLVDLADGDWYARVRVKTSDTCQPTDESWQTVYFEQSCSVEDQCQYGFGEWSTCTDGWQTRDFTVSPDTCTSPDNSTLTRACATQCEYQYSDWSECSNGWQTRNVSVKPNNCYWYEAKHQEELVQSCGDTTTTDALTLYTYESCWYGNSGGETMSLYWNDAEFSNVAWIDVSPYTDFREFAHKNVENDTTDYYDNLLTSGQGFRWNNDNKEAFSFSPGVTYYFRLYNGTHSAVETFSMPTCSGVGGVSYQQCNESCNNNADCAPNLTCTENRCRLATNTESAVCSLPPDKGLNRACNDYCSDKNECAAGLTCSWNRCRNPKNLDAVDCAAPVTNTNTSYSTLASLPQVETDTTQYCNAYCNYNRDCGPNFRCANNECRLATNPESQSCDPYDFSAQEGEKGSGDGTQNAVASASGTDKEKTDTTVTRTPVNIGSEDESSKPLEEQTALDALGEYLKNAGYSLQSLGLGFLGVILVIILLSFLTKALTKQKPPVVIKKQPVKPDVSKRIDVKEFPVMAQKPLEMMKPKPLVSLEKKSEAKKDEIQAPVEPQKSDASSVSPTPTSMMDRLKQKGVKTPKS